MELEKDYLVSFKDRLGDINIIRTTVGALTDEDEDSITILRRNIIMIIPKKHLLTFEEWGE